jgi:hypothetical protein
MLYTPEELIQAIVRQFIERAVSFLLGFAVAIVLLRGGWI